MNKQSPISGFIFGSSQPYLWTHDYLTTILTTGKHRLVRSANLISAIKMIDRIDFTPTAYYVNAYEDAEIPLGYGETMDKPTVIAQMLQLMNPKTGGRYLDIGTGSGYVAALLGVATGTEGVVYSLERKQFLADIARININKYPFLENINIVFRDGKHGFPEKAPFDGIHVSAAYDTIPQELLLQLKVGARLVAPTTDRHLHVIERVSEREFRESLSKAFFFDKIQSGIQ